MGNSATIGTNLSIDHCYSAGKISSTGFGISDPSQLSNVDTFTCYYQTDDDHQSYDVSKLVGHLQNLSPIIWHRRHDELPILKHTEH